MIIYPHDCKDRIVLELEENEFTLLAYLIEKSSQKTRNENIIKEPLDVKINELFMKFIFEEMSS